MTDELPAVSSGLPVPCAAVTVRLAVPADVPFMDALQKLHTNAVGWMPRAQFEGKIALGHVLIAESFVEATHASPVDGESAVAGEACLAPTKTPVGYVIGNDQYFKRDDLGIVYQMNVVPGRQRGLIGATLLKALFERSAWGCKLYCCWCAQDLAANKFWEAMGFVPIAFRTGSRTKGKHGTPRMHIFWQKRIRQGDDATPYWFPSQTGGGSLREDRLVLPIPPGTHWSDAKPMVLPGESPATELLLTDEATTALPKRRVRKAKVVAIVEPPKKVAKSKAIGFGGLRFGAMLVMEEAAVVVVEPIVALPVVANDVVKPKKTKAKNDPRLIAAARELRDRWLDHHADDKVPLTRAKYEVGRLMDGGAMRIEATPTKALPMLAA